MRVLIIEDEEALAAAIARGLRLQGMAVDVALDGRSGLDKACLNDYDVVILDRNLPEMPVAVHLRQVAVQNDDVIVVEARLVEAAAAVESHIYCHALESQAARDGGSESLLSLIH